MNAWSIIGVGTTALVGGAIIVGLTMHRSAMREAQEGYATLAAIERRPMKRFDPAQVAQLPEVARRYFHHAIAPGTPLYSVAELEMEGSFLLGDRDDFQTYDMSARQVLRPPHQFVWIPRMHSGMVSISGSDALVAGKAWTRFWLFGLVPVAQEHTSPDLVRSADFRAAVEGALWLPTSLLPENGVDWEEVSANRAQLTLHRYDPPIILNLTLTPSGAVREVVGQRWSNANRDKVFRLQPFGAAVSDEGTFQGLTIPTRLAAGNHYGTSEYLPFFQASLTRVSYR